MAKKDNKTPAFVIYDLNFSPHPEKDAQLIRELEKTFFMESVALVLKPIEQLALEPQKLEAFEEEKNIRPGMLMLLSDNVDSVCKGHFADLPVVMLLRGPVEEGSEAEKLWDPEFKEVAVANGHDEVRRALHLLVLKNQKRNAGKPVMRAKKKSSEKQKNKPKVC